MRAYEILREDELLTEWTIPGAAWLAEAGGLNKLAEVVKNMFSKAAPELKVAVKTGEKAMGSEAAGAASSGIGSGLATAASNIGSGVAKYAGDLGKLAVGVGSAAYAGVTALVDSLKSIGLTEWIEIAAVVGICVLGYQFAQAMIKKYSDPSPARVRSA